MIKFVTQLFSSDSHNTENQKTTFFINFNYTTTVESFSNIMTGNKYVLNIHGSLENIIENPIIFGYGDETNSHYKEIENLDNNLYMQHFKSFWYSKTDNYSKLLGCIANVKYDIYIVGHSCGLSDRILLKTIFENDNCRKIHVLHHVEKFELLFQNDFSVFLLNYRHDVKHEFFYNYHFQK